MKAPFKREATAGSLAGILLVGFSMASCGSGGSDTPGSSSSTPAPVGTTVQVSVSAEDPDNNKVTPGRDQLHYRWAATEGTINNVDAPNTTWTIPPGSGLQFAYVLVSDDKGGYTERRAAALTFAQAAVTPAVPITPPNPDPTKRFAWGTIFYKGSLSRNVYLAHVPIQLNVNGTAITIFTDMKGDFFIPNLPNASQTASYTLPGQPPVNFSIPAQTNRPTSPSSNSYIRLAVDANLRPSTNLIVAGRVELEDGAICGVRDEFFTHSTDPNLLTKPVSATAQLLSNINNPLSTEVMVNHYGDFLLTRTALGGPTSAKVRIRCEQAPDEVVTLTLPASGEHKLESISLPPMLLSTIKLPNNRPTVKSLTITAGGQDISRPDLPQPTTLLDEMQNAPGDDTFLTYKGLDTRRGACQYYKAIGAVQDCNPDGFPLGAQLTLGQWRKKFNLSAGDPAEVTAKFVNSMDLNFGRDYQGIKRPNGDIAINVCNYPGPQDVTRSDGAPTKIGMETPADINLSIENMRRGIGKIVCVAMDNSAIPPANNGDRFVKFYIFGPAENLLLSVSLDGRREKFVPGSCVACHGGDNYGGKFPEDGSGLADLGSYFLPFDVANFAFSTSDPTLARGQLLRPLRQLNELLVSIPQNAQIQPVTADTRTLITTRWYTSPTSDEQQQPAPPTYSNQQIAGTGARDCTDCHASAPQGPYDATLIHRDVIGPSCQVCHASNSIVDDPQAEGSARITFFERPPAHYLQDSGLHGPHTVCGGSPDLKMNHTMPNALATFERFWLKKGIDQPRSLFLFPPPKQGQQPGCMFPFPHPGL